MCRDCRIVNRFTSVGCVLAALEICNRSVFALFVGSAAVIGVASLLRIGVFFVHAIAFGIAALFADLHVFFRGCHSVVRFAASWDIAAMSWIYSRL